MLYHRSDWSVGVTTSPRSEFTLQHTIDSVINAGWSDIHIFAEPNSTKVNNVVWHQREEVFGAYKNWYEALKFLVDFDTNIAIVQDDVILSSNLRLYLDMTIGEGVYSPYTSKRVRFTEKNWKENYVGWIRHNPGWDLMGAQIFVMKPETAKRVLNGMPKRVENNRNIDARVGLYCKNHDLPLFCHSPSLAEHVGNSVSTIGNNTTKFRVAEDVVDDCLSIL